MRNFLWPHSGWVTISCKAWLSKLRGFVSLLDTVNWVCVSPGCSRIDETLRPSNWATYLKTVSRTNEPVSRIKSFAAWSDSRSRTWTNLSPGKWPQNSLLATNRSVWIWLQSTSNEDEISVYLDITITVPFVDCQKRNVLRIWRHKYLSRYSSSIHYFPDWLTICNALEWIHRRLLN